MLGRPMTFVLNEFKTSAKYGQLSIDVNEEVAAAIKTYLMIAEPRSKPQPTELNLHQVSGTGRKQGRWK